MCHEPIETLRLKRAWPSLLDRPQPHRFPISSDTEPVRLIGRVRESTAQTKLLPEYGSRSVCFSYESTHILLLHHKPFVCTRSCMSKRDPALLKAHWPRNGAPQSGVNFCYAGFPHDLSNVFRFNSSGGSPRNPVCGDTPKLRNAIHPLACGR